MTTERLQSFVSSLTPAELQKALGLIKARLSTQGIAADADDSEWVLQVICEFFRSIGLMHSAMGAQQLRKMAARDMKGLKEKLPNVLHLMDGLNRAERHVFLRLGIELLYNNLGDIGITVTPVTLLRHFHRIPYCIEHEFPGYARQGFLKLIVASVLKRRTGEDHG